MQNTEKSFWNSDKAVSAAKAPNSVSITGRDRADKFRNPPDVAPWNLLADSPVLSVSPLLPCTPETEYSFG
jgi:hypothetical protein